MGATQATVYVRHLGGHTSCRHSGAAAPSQALQHLKLGCNNCRPYTNTCVLTQIHARLRPSRLPFQRRTCPACPDRSACGAGWLASACTPAAQPGCLSAAAAPRGPGRVHEGRVGISAWAVHTCMHRPGAEPQAHLPSCEATHPRSDITALPPSTQLDCAGQMF